MQAFAKSALENHRLSLAIATAMQFETTLRQRDVIGEWPPLKPGEEPSGIVYRGRRWVNGLTWADLADDLELRKTTKTGRFAAHDFKQLPFLLDLLNRCRSSAGWVRSASTRRRGVPMPEAPMVANGE